MRRESDAVGGRSGSTTSPLSQSTVCAPGGNAPPLVRYCCSFANLRTSARVAAGRLPNHSFAAAGSDTASFLGVIPLGNAYTRVGLGLWVEFVEMLAQPFRMKRADPPSDALDVVRRIGRGRASAAAGSWQAHAHHARPSLELPAMAACGSSRVQFSKIRSVMSLDLSFFCEESFQNAARVQNGPMGSEPAVEAIYDPLPKSDLPMKSISGLRSCQQGGKIHGLPVWVVKTEKIVSAASWLPARFG